MTKQQLQMLYDRMKIENETYKQFITHTHGPQALDRLNLEIAVQQLDEVCKEYRIDENMKKYEH